MMLVYTSFIFAIPDWRLFVFRLFKRNMVRGFRGDKMVSEKAQETYFKQLAKSWTWVWDQLTNKHCIDSSIRPPGDPG